VDQQVGGLLMWVPTCLVYLCGILGLLARWYGNAEEEGRAFVQNPKSEIPLRPFPEKN
jgi:putative membrane protein